VLLPIHLDRWVNPIASKLRECAVRIHAVDFYSFSGPDTPEDSRESKGLWERANLHRMRASQLLSSSYDAVHHGSSTPANLFATFAAKARGLGKTTHIFTASVEVHSEDPYYRYYLLSLKTADKVLAVSQAVARSVHDKLGRAVDEIVPNGIDLDYFSAAAARPIPSCLENIGPFALFVGALLPRKRPDAVLELARLNPAVKFVMLGRKAEAVGGGEIVKRARHVPNIIYLGEREKTTVRDLMAEATLLVFPSELEGLPNVLLEASAMGLPILAQPKSSMRDIVQENVNGWLIPIDHMDGWSKRLKEIVSWGEGQRQAFSNRARALAEKSFSWDKSVEKLKRIYMQSSRS
jgi:glycosyltransferase involved in cell wall biosynthesis